MSEVVSSRMDTFAELSNQELLFVDGGFAVTVTAALIALGATCVCAGFAGGIAVGLNRKNRT